MSQPSKDLESELDDDCAAHLVLIAKTKPTKPIKSILHIKKTLCTIGRTEDCDLTLDSTAKVLLISRSHAKLEQIEVDGEHKWRLRDEKSVNGTFVNNVKVQEIILNDRDIITFGGGGGLAVGATKEQPNSEFIYQFRSKGTIEGIVARKRKLAEESYEYSQQSDKKQKVSTADLTAEHSLTESPSSVSVVSPSTFEEELKRKEAQIEEQNRKLKELEEIIEQSKQEVERSKKLQEEKEMQLNQEKRNFHEELERLQTEHAKMLEEEKKQVETSYICRSEIEEEFTCTICQELILCAMTIECSHSFCSSCILNWLERKKQCPVCREVITKTPVRSRNLDNVISKMVARLKSKDKAEWDERLKAQAKNAEEETVTRKLQELITQAKSRNLKFLSIYDNWTPDERRVFLDGVSRYNGKPRLLYCETTGLTKDFLDRASVMTLRVVAANLGISIPIQSLPITELKEKIIAFMEGRNVQQQISRSTSQIITIQ